ncbi:hypothetical protein ACU6TU_08305 [Halomonas sp. LS-001]
MMHNNKQLAALGRLKAGQMNKTEAAYAQYLEMRKRAGDIQWYRFDGIKLRLADKTFLTVDFAVMAEDGVMELHDTKGSPRIFTDDARVKMKVAAELYPFRFKVAYPQAKKHGGGWHIEEIAA